VGEQITLSAWVMSVRDQKSVQFVILGDATGRVQVTNERGDDERSRTISGLTVNSVVRVTGRVAEEPRVKLGGIEIHLDEIEVLSLAEPELPIDETSSSDKRQQWRFVDLRQPRNRLMFEVTTTVLDAMRHRWIEDGFIEIQSPKLMGSPSESGAEVFKVQYFDRFAYLAQSPQFYKQMAIAAGFDQVFEIAQAFRAEPSFTPIHATEFTSVDAEIGWIDSHADVMAYEERWLQSVFEHVLDRHGADMKEILGVDRAVPEAPFPKIPMREARAIIERMGGTNPADKEDIDPAGQRLLSEHVKSEFGHEFVFVTDYPVDVRPFYHMRHSEDSDLTRSFDLFWNSIEVTTGAQREHRPDVLERQAAEKGISTDSVGYYLDFFRYGCPPHGGLGFGLARWLMVFFGRSAIREVTLLHRTPNRIEP
jgi:aspartyl-tRNA synthetase